MPSGPREPHTFKLFAETLLGVANPWFTIVLSPLNGHAWDICVGTPDGEDVSIPVTHPMAVQLVETFLAVLADAA